MSKLWRWHNYLFCLSSFVGRCFLRSAMPLIPGNMRTITKSMQIRALQNIRPIRIPQNLKGSGINPWPSADALPWWQRNSRVAKWNGERLFSCSCRPELNYVCKMRQWHACQLFDYCVNAAMDFDGRLKATSRSVSSC